MAMSVMQNTEYEKYLEDLSQRLVKPNMLMVWSTWHPLFPQVKTNRLKPKALNWFLVIVWQTV
jgi:hypothetical protein